MSLEQPNNQMPEKNPGELENSEKFDAKGNPRTLRTMPESGLTALMSQEEYEAELEASK